MSQIGNSKTLKNIVVLPLTTCSFKNALKDGPDFVIKLECFTWHVHAEILTRESGYFRLICNGNYWKESKERQITIHDDNPAMFARLLQFLYHGSYTYYPTETSGTRSALGPRVYQPTVEDLLACETNRDVHYEIANITLGDYAQTDLDVYELADKYDIPSLSAFALKRCVSNSPHVVFLTDMFAGYYPDRTSQDPNLGKVIALLIAKNYDFLKSLKDEWDDGIGKWLMVDSELRYMVDCAKTVLAIQYGGRLPY